MLKWKEKKYDSNNLRRRLLYSIYEVYKLLKRIQTFVYKVYKLNLVDSSI